MKKIVSGKRLKLILLPLRSTAIMIFTYFIASGEMVLNRNCLFLIVHLTGAMLGSLVMGYFVPESVIFYDFLKFKRYKFIQTIPLLNVSFSFFMIPFIAGIETRFLHIPMLCLEYLQCGILLYAVCFFIAHWAFISDAFCKKNKKNNILNVGPYRIIRFPKYLSISLSSLSLSLMSGSRLSLIPSIAITVLMVMQTYEEDSQNIKKSEKYRVYADKIRFRMVPGLW